MLQQQETGSHDGHAGNDAQQSPVVVAVFFSTGQQFVERNVDHDAGDEGQQEGIEGGGPEGEEEDEAQQGAERFGHAGKKGQVEGFFPALRGMVDGDGNRDAFGNVVNGDGKNDGE